MNEQHAVELTELLKDNPQWLASFLQQHPALMAEMQFSHLSSNAGGKTVSLVERQVDVLREKVKHLERGIAEMIRNAQENDAIASKLYDLARAMLTTHDAQVLPLTAEDKVRRLYAVPSVALKLWNVSGEFADLPYVLANSDEAVAIDEMKSPYCGDDVKHVGVAWLGEDAASVKSVALVPLRVGLNPKTFGLLVLGSPDAERFAAKMGTAFLERIGEVLSAGLSRLTPAQGLDA